MLKTELVPPPMPRKYSPESLGRRAETLDDAVASADIRFGDQRYESVEGMAGALPPCLALL